MVMEIGKGVRLGLEKNVDDSYEIIIEQNIFPRVARELKEMNLGSQYAIITDDHVKGLQWNCLEQTICDAGIKATVFDFPEGEESKNAQTCLDIIGRMQSAGFGRDSAIIALGGGVAGDMAGFIAGIFNRGIPYIQIPTTTISQADSAIGGKTGVDTEHGKNLVGVFKQPKRVYIDVSTLLTLREHDYVCGLAETIKHAIICDESYFGWLEQNREKILKRDLECLEQIAYENCLIKGNVVEQDPNEKGLRRILNYGHTVGHAMEKHWNYALKHGFVVSMGMMVAGNIAVDLGLFNPVDLKRQRDLLDAFGLPVDIPYESPHTSDADAIIAATRSDKKSAGGKVRYCLPSKIGKMNEFDGAYALHVDDAVVKRAIEAIRGD